MAWPNPAPSAHHHSARPREITKDNILLLPGAKLQRVRLLRLSLQGPHDVEIGGKNCFSKNHELSRPDELQILRALGN